MDISVIILSYNTRDLLRACLRSVEADRGDLAVQTIVVDNASSDGSAAMVRSEFPDVELIASATNLGFAGGNNRALERCVGQYVLLLNSDAELHPGALAALAGYLDAHPRAGAAGARLLNSDGTLQPSAFGFPTLGQMALAMTRLSQLVRGHNETGRITWSEAPIPVDWITGACFMVRREVVAAVGPLDETFFFDYEDVDWCRRIRDAGWEIHTVPAAVATHHRWQSKAQLGEQALSGDESACTYFRKHHGAAGERVVRTLLVWFHAGAWLKYCLRAALTRDAADHAKRRRHALGALRFGLGRRATHHARPTPSDQRAAPDAQRSTLNA